MGFSLQRKKPYLPLSDKNHCWSLYRQRIIYNKKVSRLRLPREDRMKMTRIIETVFTKCLEIRTIDSRDMHEFDLQLIHARKELNKMEEHHPKLSNLIWELNRVIIDSAISTQITNSKDIDLGDLPTLFNFLLRRQDIPELEIPPTTTMIWQVAL